MKNDKGGIIPLINVEYIIHSRSEHGFWNNEDGWVCDIKDATRFNEDYVKMWSTPSILSKDDDQEWIQVYYNE